MKILVKIFGTVVSLAAGWLGTKLVSTIWKQATGDLPPTPANPEQQQQENLGKVLTFAVISGAGAAVIQAVTKRWTRGLETKVRAH
ncbi:DUF4235 domain-containing protein [Glutamicibacter sp. NPDC087344]|uniref:DUF4235 domain-containing protein n=1 Tax=Glutamicibacter sp. NPDC087344 TaxID=3363994 RepID=UPI00382DB572